LRQVGLVYRHSETPGRVQGPTAAPGAHTAEVRADLANDASTVVPKPVASSAGSPAPAHPLAGVVVLDLGFAVAGPFGTQILADLGATVIKVNARRDPWWHCTHIAMGANRGKRSVGIDLKTTDGMAALHRLVRQADVVHMNIRAGAARRLGVDEASMRAINPTIIYCHTRGFEDGPRSDSPANDQTGNALAGTEYEDGGCADGGAPFWSLTSMGDTGNGFLSAIGVIQALYHRAKTGVGQRVDTSILNAAMLATSYAATTGEGAGLDRTRLDAMQTGIGALYGLYPTADDWLCIVVLNEAHWKALLSVVPALERDARFATAAARASADAELRDALRAELATRSAADWFAVLDGAGVPCEISSEHFAEEFFDDPAMREAGWAVTYDHPELGRFDHSGLAIDFSETPGIVWGPPPLVGEHTRAVLAEFGFRVEEIDALVASDAVFETLSVNG
jgi:crotonobetainyl-CoA:carnitine CoA-transferase CaiB-like acyl-CoA transferase